MAWAAAAVVAAPAAALEMTFDRRTIEQALEIAHSTIESTHRQFHRPYRFTIGKAPVDFVEIVSPFRRLVLAAETELRLGRRMFGQREALAALQPDPARLEVYAELTFHPLNTFVDVPEYRLLLVPAAAGGPPVAPTGIDRLPRYGPRLDDSRYPFPYPYSVAPRVPAGSEPLRGGTLIGRFDGGRLDPKGVYVVSIVDGNTELARTKPIDLLALR